MVQIELPIEITGLQLPLPDDLSFYVLELCVDAAMLHDLLSAVYLYSVHYETEAGYRLYAALLQVLDTEWDECE